MSTIVFWHGWGRGPGIWDELIDHLRPMLSPGDELIAQALPGYTPDQNPVIYYSVSDMIDDLMKDLSSPVILCGWSMGAIIAMLAALRFPNDVDELILIGATPNFTRKTDWPDGVPFNQIDKLASGIRVDPASALRRFLTSSNQDDVNAKEVVRKLTGVSSASIPSLEAGLDLLRHTDIRSIAHELRQRTLLIHGARDKLMPLSSAQWLKKTMRHAELVVFPEAAHAPFLSDPEGCAKAIADFLDA